MRKRMKALAIFFCLLGYGCSFAQTKWQGSIFIGGANYQGDLVETTAPLLSETNFAAGLSGRYFLSSSLKIRGDFFYGKLSGSDENASQKGLLRRNFSFESQLFELSGAIEWSPFATKLDSLGNRTSRKFFPYVFAGVAGYRVNPTNSFDTDISNGFTDKIEADQSINYPKSGISIPIGGGLQLNTSRAFFVNIEVGARMADEDYFDGVSIAANPEKNDWYWFGGIGLGLRFIPKDTDFDGLADKEDECPNKKGELALGGCPDTDRDGVIDKDDLCPEEFGLNTLNGCPDQDSDGIMDALDDCPDLYGILATNGCPDNDLDAIADHFDQCPNLAGTLAGNGCPLLDVNANGSLEDEMEALQHPNILDELNEYQKNYWWLNQPEIWAILSW